MRSRVPLQRELTDISPHERRVRTASLFQHHALQTQVDQLASSKTAQLLHKSSLDPEKVHQDLGQLLDSAGKVLFDGLGFSQQLENRRRVEAESSSSAWGTLSNESPFAALLQQEDNGLVENAKRVAVKLARKGRAGPEKGGEHPRVGADVRVNLANYLNFQYTGPLQMGSENQEVTVVYDTGSDWLVLETDFCSNCIDPVFDTATSSTYNQDGQSLETVTYGSAQLNGYHATDSVSLDESTDPKTRIDSFQFFAAASQTGLTENFDGILGMSRQLVTQDFTHGPLFVEALKNEGLISKEQVSFYITDTSEQSFVDFGEMDTSAIKDGDPSNVVCLDMPVEHLFWLSSEVQAIKIGPNVRTEYGFTGHYNFGEYAFPAIYDTGTSLIYPPTLIASEIISRIVSGLTYQFDQQSGLVVVDCSEKERYPDLELMIDGHWTQILHKDYFLSLESDEGEEICILAFLLSDYQSFWLLGDAFLNGYYSIHDNDDHANAKFCLAPHATSEKAKVWEGEMPGASILDLQWEFNWVFSVYKFFDPDFQAGDVSFWRWWGETNMAVEAWLLGALIFMLTGQLM